MYHQPTASSHCPICFTDTPHQHSGKQVHEYREEELEWNRQLIKEYEAKLPEQAVRRKIIQDQYAKERANKIKALKNYNKDHPCEFCRDLQHGFGNGEQFGLIYNGNTIKCPKCDKCFWSDES